MEGEIPQKDSSQEIVESKDVEDQQSELTEKSDDTPHLGIINANPETRPKPYHYFTAWNIFIVLIYEIIVTFSVRLRDDYKVFDFMMERFHYLC